MKVVPLRLQPGVDLRKALEILSLSGTLSADGTHLHIAIADSSCAVIGGHLCPGSFMRTTAELAIKLQPER